MHTKIPPVGAIVIQETSSVLEGGHPTDTECLWTCDERKIVTLGLRLMSQTIATYFGITLALLIF